MAIKILFYENHYFIYLPQTLPPLTDIHAHTLFLKPNSIFLLESQILPAYSGYTDLLCPNPTEMRNHECKHSDKLKCRPFMFGINQKNMVKLLTKTKSGKQKSKIRGMLLRECRTERQKTYLYRPQKKASWRIQVQPSRIKKGDGTSY